SQEEYEGMPPRVDGEWLCDNFSGAAQSMHRFVEQVTRETGGKIVSEIDIIRIPLDLYRARNVTSRKWLPFKREEHPFAGAPVYLAGDSAIGSPYFQSISLGFECAMFLAGLLGQRDLPLAEAFNRYEDYMYKQWIRVYMRSKMIKHNKD